MADKSTSMGSNSKIAQSPQEMGNQGFDGKYNAPLSVGTSEDISVSPNVLRRVEYDGPYALRVAVDSGDSNVTYVGKAAPGSLTSTQTWRIQKIDETSGTIITWADGDTDYDNEWDERENLSYS